MTIKLTLNVPSQTETIGNLKEAAKRKADATESLEDAWTRILAMKNSDADMRRLQEVKQAMDSGQIGREKASANKRFSRAEALRLYTIIAEKKKEEMLRRMVEETPSNYRLITDKDDLNEVIAELLNEDMIVFDVESTGVDVWEDKIVGHVLSATSSDMHYYIPTGHKDKRDQLDGDYVIDKLRAVYEDGRIKKIAHNLKYDYQMLKRAGINVAGVYWDTQEAMRLLNENENSYALKPLVTKYLKIESLGYADLFGKGTGFDEIDLDTALAYAAKDGDITYKLYEFQRKHMEATGNILEYFQTVEMPILPIVADMEMRGYLIDRDFAEEYGEKLRVEADESYRKVVEVMGDINLNSPVQLKQAIEEHIGKPIENTDAKQTLKPLSREYPIIAELLNYREKTKLLSTYIDALPELIREASGRLHTTFNQNGAKTGRFSSSGGVNLQNQPSEARKMFVAPQGSVLLGGDWSQQEYRCLAYYSQDDYLVDNYVAGNDLYTEVASDVFKKPREECGDGSIYRDRAKVLMLAIAYGGGANMLANSIGVPKKDAKAFLKEFLEKYKGVDRWIKENQSFVKRNGFVWLGDRERKRRLPGARNPNNPSFYSSVYTQSTNARVQGTAAIQTKKTMIALEELCKRKTAEGKGEWSLWVVVHDEAILCVPETITEKDIRDFEDVMVNTHVFGDIPNKCDIEIQRRWGDSVKLADYLKGKPVPSL